MIWKAMACAHKVPQLFKMIVVDLVRHTEKLPGSHGHSIKAGNENKIARKTHCLVLWFLFQQSLGIWPRCVILYPASVPQQVLEVLSHFPPSPLFLCSLFLQFANLLFKEQPPAKSNSVQGPFFSKLISNLSECIQAMNTNPGALYRILKALYLQLR